MSYWIVILVVQLLIGIATDYIMSRKGRTGGLLLGFFLGLLGLIIGICLSDQRGGRSNGEHDRVIALQGYKDMLDKGIITEEEFEKKKKQLLK